MSGSGDHSYSRDQLSKLLGSLVQVARERIMGRHDWLPRNNDTVVEVPAQIRDSVRTVGEFEPFKIFHSTSGSTVISPLYHIGLKHKNTLFSLVRWGTQEEALEDLGRIRPFSELFFHLMEQTPAALYCASVEQLIRAIRTHSLWNPVHIAAKIGIKGYFENLLEDEVEAKHVLHSTCQPEGRYPLHIAVENSQADIVRFMLEKLKVSVSQVDRLGQNAFHYAARTSAEMIRVVTADREPSSCINTLSKDGYTPLFMAVASARPSCAAVLLKQGARLNIYCHGRSAVHEAMLQTGPKVSGLIKTLYAASPESFNVAEAETGNSALHVAGNKQTILALLACNPKFNLEARNLNGQTALHLHTYNANLSCVAVLICKNADIDAQDEDGNTCLHIAVSNQNEPITKLLLLFGADPNIVNINNETPRHLAVKLSERRKEFVDWLVLCGAKPCSNLKIYTPPESPHYRLCLGKFPPQLNVRQENEEDRILESFMQSQSIKNVQSKIRDGKKMSVVLTLDGGGTRGIVMIQVLLMIEQHLKIPLNHVVDWLGGTSTGALLGTAFALGQPLRSVQKLYMLLKDEIFEGRSRPYSSDRMEESLKGIVGPSATMADISSTKLVITSVLIKNRPLRLHIFRNYQLPGAEFLNKLYDFENPKELLLWKVLRCTTAAPTYFSSVDNMYVDGGLIANNPSLDTLAEIHRYNCAVQLSKEGEKVEIGCLISIGTGRTPERPLPAMNFDSSNPLELLPAARNYMSIVVNQLTASEGAPVDRTRSWCQDLNIPYFRFSTPLSRHFRLDTKSDEDMVQMMWETLEYVTSRKDKVNELTSLLLLISSTRRLPVYPKI